MSINPPKRETIKTDLLIIGGGAAGCAAAIEAKELRPDLDVTVVEKAHIHRSGCLAMGLNAINAYLPEGATPDDYVASTKRDSHGVIREDLVRSIAENINSATHRVEEWGLPIPRDGNGRPFSKGPRSIRILGESLKPILARRVAKVGARVINRHTLSDLLSREGKVYGGLFTGVRTGDTLEVRARATIIATGGASGLYRTPNRGDALNRMWYSPFNVGTGYAATLRAGAELTTLEMRFIPTRLRHTCGPTGTLAQTFGAREENLLGERFNKRYAQKWGTEKLTSPQRLRAMMEELKEGRGPVFLNFSQSDQRNLDEVMGAYLDMTPSQVAIWASEGFDPSNARMEVGTSGPYIIGGHTGSGLWVDVGRRTTLEGLYAAGDVAGGAPKKYVSGAWVEGFTAARSALADIESGTLPAPAVVAVDAPAPIAIKRGELTVAEGIERLQRVMDEYGGGLSTHYEIHGTRLAICRDELRGLEEDLFHLDAPDPHQLLLAGELRDRVLTARALVEHMDSRRETRWPGYQTRVDYPDGFDDGLLFVNSRLAGGEIKTFTRGLGDTGL